MHRLTLRQRLILIVLLPALLLAAGLTGFLLQRSNAAADAALRDRALAIVSFLAPAAEYGVIAGNRHALETLLVAVLEQRDVAAASIVDTEGMVLAGSGRRSLGPAELLQVAGARGARAIRRSDDRLAAIAPVELAPPLGIEDDRRPTAAEDAALVIGWVHVELDTAPLEAYKRETMVSILSIAALVLMLTVLLALGLSGAVSRPLARLADAGRRMAEGKLDTRVPENADIAELRTLQQGFNRMAEAIAEAQQNMQIRIDEATARLAHQATHDPLTGLPNRRAFERALEDAVTASRRASDASVLCFIDLDRFKPINDTVGHAAGDALLVQIATLIRERVRAADLLCRIGGDEFGLILRDCGMEEARGIAENLRRAVANHRFEWEGRSFGVGLSIGLVALDGSMGSPGDALVAADLACYAAKRKGRNRVEEHVALPGDSQF